MEIGMFLPGQAALNIQSSNDSSLMFFQGLFLIIAIIGLFKLYDLLKRNNRTLIKTKLTTISVVTLAAIYSNEFILYLTALGLSLEASNLIVVFMDILFILTLHYGFWFKGWIREDILHKNENNLKMRIFSFSKYLALSILSVMAVGPKLNPMLLKIWENPQLMINDTWYFLTEIPMPEVHYLQRIIVALILVALVLISRVTIEKKTV